MRPRRVGRYAVFDELGHGGMATVYLGRACGAAGFARTVAVKQLHPPYSRDQAFIAMLMDEASLTSRIAHPNVVSTLDVCEHEGELLVVMEYVLGVPLLVLADRAAKQGGGIDVKIAASIAVAILRGLHAAHEARDEQGHPLGIVHRDVSPQNVMVGADGLARVIDFGVAKAARRLQTTEDGTIKGKLGYASPEQLFGEPVDRRSDVFSVAVMLWEMLVGERLFVGRDGEPALLVSLRTAVDPPSFRRRGLPSALDGIVLRALEPARESRFQTAADMADELSRVLELASERELSAWVRSLARDELDARAAQLAQVEAAPFAVIDEAVQPSAASERAVTPSTASALEIEASRRRRTWLVGIVGAVIGAAIAVLAAVFLTNRTTAALLPSGSDAAQETQAVDDRGEALQDAGESAGPDAEADAEPDAEEDRRRADGAAARGPRNHRRRPPRPPAAKTVDPVLPLCDPPFVIDENGRKQYKRECFRK